MLFRSPSESGNREIARKSLVAAKPITKGQALTADLLDVKRPGDGISPMRWTEILGRRANRSYEPDELIDAEILEMK